MPYFQEPDTTSNILAVAEFDTLIAEAGTVALESVLKRNKSLKRVIWVAKAGSKHLDWNEVPEGVGGKVDVTTWHDLVEENKAGSSNEVPPLDKDNDATPVYAFWPTKSGNYEIIEYAQKVRCRFSSTVQILTLAEPHGWHRSTPILYAARPQIAGK